MLRKVNKNLTFLIHALNKEGIRGVCLEGSSRSGKTIACVDFCIYVGARVGQNLTINIIKETYNSFKTTLYDDFSKRLDAFGINNPFRRSKEISTFDLLGNKINFIGADKESKFLGASCDILWINEALDVQNNIFDQSEMRCRRMFILDYNPKLTAHSVYDKIIPRDDVLWLHSTFKDNPFISDVEQNKIMSYEPTLYNKSQGTVDAFKWKVYGLGVRAAMEGLIFPNVTWIDCFPEISTGDGCDYETYGLDFGYTQDPSALTRCGVKLNPGFAPKLYLELKFYTPTKDPNVLAKLVMSNMPDDKHCWCDSADPGMIADLKHHGINAYGVFKFRGSIVYGVNLINKFDIYIVRNEYARKEQENYKYKMIQGIQLNEPEDLHNHFWDSARYGVLSEFKYLTNADLE